MSSRRAQIEALWFEPGTAADAAAAINARLPRVRWVSPAQVRDIWKSAERQGRLTSHLRGRAGFGDPEIARLMQKLGRLLSQRTESNRIQRRVAA